MNTERMPTNEKIEALIDQLDCGARAETLFLQNQLEWRDVYMLIDRLQERCSLNLAVDLEEALGEVTPS